MLTVICGDDNSASRKYYVDLQVQFKNQQKEIIFFPAKDFFDLSLWLGDSLSLFSLEKVFFTENLDKYYSKRDKKNAEKISDLSQDKNIEIYDWENKSLWELKLKTLAKTKEFKLSATIFKLLDNFQPGNKQIFYNTLITLLKNTDASFIFSMLARQVRSLILLKTGQELERTTPWQAAKLKSQIKLWSQEKLFNVYEALHKIDIGIKTSSTPFSQAQSLDIITCYFL